MRKASIVLAIAACVASPLSLAQQRDPAPATAEATTRTSADQGGGERKQSGFGQVMSVLTGLLQDAAGKESTGTSTTASQTLSSEESAVVITVTPVEGRSTFFVGRPSDGKPRPVAGSATSSTRVAVATTEASATDAARVAMQADATLPD